MVVSLNVAKSKRVYHRDLYLNLLFIIFINDLMELKNCYLYADDCLLVTSMENPDISTKLMEKSTHQASSWYSENSFEQRQN